PAARDDEAVPGRRGHRHRRLRRVLTGLVAVVVAVGLLVVGYGVAIEPRLVMMHHPTTFPQLAAGTAPLAVAGHTHCGQIALPLLSRWSCLGLTEEEELVAEGFAAAGYGAAGNGMFLTCGIGFSLLPVRINAPPQLLTVELRPA
ncbi:hypothetical protein, partial [Kocuria rhizosphaericola]|uniref:hypothetical protein n=1 Tax=Kocuria rhizosphaericola TaxID=3376284 RepID=UPI0037AF3933